MTWASFGTPQDLGALQARTHPDADGRPAPPRRAVPGDRGRDCRSSSRSRPSVRVWPPSLQLRCTRRTFIPAEIRMTAAARLTLQTGIAGHRGAPADSRRGQSCPSAPLLTKAALPPCAVHAISRRSASRPVVMVPHDSASPAGFTLRNGRRGRGSRTSSEGIDHWFGRLSSQLHAPQPGSGQI
jgi:hypothetical protein